MYRGYVTRQCDRIFRPISRAPERLRSETEHGLGGDLPSVFSAVIELVEPLLDDRFDSRTPEGLCILPAAWKTRANDQKNV